MRSFPVLLLIIIVLAAGQEILREPPILAPAALNFSSASVWRNEAVPLGADVVLDFSSWSRCDRDIHFYVLVTQSVTIRSLVVTAHQDFAEFRCRTSLLLAAGVTLTVTGSVVVEGSAMVRLVGSAVLKADTVVFRPRLREQSGPFLMGSGTIDARETNFTNSFLYAGQTTTEYSSQCASCVPGGMEETSEYGSLEFSGRLFVAGSRLVAKDGGQLAQASGRANPLVAWDRFVSLDYWSWHSSRSLVAAVNLSLSAAPAGNQIISWSQVAITTQITLLNTMSDLNAFVYHCLRICCNTTSQCVGNDQTNVAPVPGSANAGSTGTNQGGPGNPQPPGEGGEGGGGGLDSCGKASSSGLSVLLNPGSCQPASPTCASVLNPTPCLNGGVCIATFTGFCSCPPAYEGEQCEALRNNNSTATLPPTLPAADKNNALILGLAIGIPVAIVLGIAIAVAVAFHHQHSVRKHEIAFRNREMTDLK